MLHAWALCRGVAARGSSDNWESHKTPPRSQESKLIQEKRKGKGENKKITKPFECNILVEHQSMSKGGSFSWSGEFKL